VEEVVRRDTSNRRVEQFDHVECGEFSFAGASKSAHELKQAAWIRGNDGVGVGGEEMADFAVAELLRGFRLEQIVDSGGTAAK
jgi:hypothetical protein